MSYYGKAEKRFCLWGSLMSACSYDRRDSSEGHERINGDPRRKMGNISDIRRFSRKRVALVGNGLPARQARAWFLMRQRYWHEISLLVMHSPEKTAIRVPRCTQWRRITKRSLQKQGTKSGSRPASRRQPFRFLKGPITAQLA